MTAGSADTIAIADGAWVLKADFDRQGYDLTIEGPDGQRLLIQDYFAQGGSADLDLGGGTLRGHVVERLAGPMAEGQYAQTGASDGSAIGAVDTIDGEAWATRVDGTRVALTPGSEIFMGDVVETAAGSSITMTFVDGTSFSLSADARMVIDELVYDPGSATNTASFSLVQGLFVMVSGDVAKTGDMTIETPVSTIGIRGTSVAIQAATEGLQNLITLLADPDGNVGIIEVATLVASVILNTLGASTIVTSSGLAPSAVEVLTAEQIEQAFQSALSTMQLFKGESLGVIKDVEGDTPDGRGDEGASDDGVPSPEEAQAFLDAVNELIVRLNALGVDGEDLTEAEEDALLEASEVVLASHAPQVIVSMPDKERNPDQVGGEVGGGGDEGSGGGVDDLIFFNNGDAFGSNLAAQFGVAASGALGTLTNNPIEPEGFVNTDQPGGFFFNPNGADNFGDPITSGNPSSGYTVGIEAATIEERAAPVQTFTGTNASQLNELGVTTEAEIQGDSVVATSTGGNALVEFTQTVSVTSGTSYVVVQVLLQNLTAEAATLYYLQSINPNQDAVGDMPTDDTYNQVLENPASPGNAIVAATGPNSGVDFVLFSSQDEIDQVNEGLDGADVDVRAAVSPILTFEDDPTAGYLFANPNEGGSTADVAINLTFVIDELAAGSTAFLSFVLSMNIASDLGDYLFAKPDATTVDGLAGDDFIFGGATNDLLTGGADNDQIDAGSGNDAVYWEDGDGVDIADGGAGNDALGIMGSSTADTVIEVLKNSDNDVIVGVDDELAVIGSNFEFLEILTGDGDDEVVIGNLLGTAIGGATPPPVPGDIDAFVANQGLDNVWLNDGSATFDAGQSVSAGILNTDVALGDLDGDGDLDAFLTDACGGGRVFFNDGLGTFTNSGQTIGSGPTQAVDLADFDDDGDLDAVVANGCSGAVVFFNDGDGTFGAAAQTFFGSATEVAAGDLDGDGDIDVVASGEPGTAIFYNDGNGSFSQVGDTFEIAVRQIALGDLDGDGDVDALTASNYGVVAVMNEGGGDVSYGAPVGPGFANAVAVGDLDGDGDLDGFATGYYGSQVFLNDGCGTFTEVDQSLAGLIGRDVALADLDGDGDLDAFMVDGCGPNHVFLNIGNGSFVDGGQSFASAVGRAVALGDLDDDGEPGDTTPPVIAVLGDGDDSANAAIAGVSVMFFGEDGDDQLIGGVGGDLLDGGSGNDGLFGNLGDDVLDGGSGNDLLQGSGGNDTLLGDDGNDVLDGGADNDTVDGGEGNDLILWQGGDSGAGSDGDDVVDGGGGDDVLALMGHGGDDQFDIQAAGFVKGIIPSTLFIEHEPSGDEIVATDIERITVNGGDGNDAVTLSGDFAYVGVDSITFEGGDGDDFLMGYGQRSESVEITAFGGDGNDVLAGGEGNDLLSGGADNDELAGAEGNDVIFGDTGDDEIYWYGGRFGYGGTYGGGSFDSGSYDGGTFAGDGNDIIDGGDGFDTLYVTSDYYSEGDFVTLGVGGLDEVADGTELLVDIDGGNAVLSVTNVERVVVDLSDEYDVLLINGDISEAGVEQVTVYGNGGADFIIGDLDFLYGAYSGLDDLDSDSGTRLIAFGGDGNDYMIGTGGDDRLSGGADNDILLGGSGNDELFGDDGDDLAGWVDGSGFDMVEGGAGNDAMVVITDRDEASTVTVSQNGGNDVLVEVDGTLAAILDEVELLSISTGEGNDHVVIENVFGTDLRGLAEPGGGGDIDAFVTGSNPNHVWLNDGSGTFSAGENVSAGPSTSDVALGDLDGDGDLDAFLTDACGGGRVFLNDGEGTLNNSGQSLGSASRAGVLGDFDGDGDLDAFAANSCGGGQVFVNDGNASFTDSGQSLLAGQTKRAAAAGDVDGDGDLDLVVGSNGGTSVLLNDGAGTFFDGGFAAGTFVQSVALGDLDGDGDLDAAVGTSYNARVLLNDGTGSFSYFGQQLGFSAVTNLALGDVDGDGDLDVVAAAFQAAVFLNDGNGTFSFFGNQTFGAFGTQDVALDDLDGDGDLDAFLVNSCYGGQVFFNDGNGSFVDSGQTLSGFGGQDLALGDLDNDGAGGTYGPPVFVDLGEGDDVADASDAGVSVFLDGDDGDDMLLGSELGDTIQGGDGNDDIVGNGGADTIDGDDGNDVIAWQGGDSAAESDGDDAIDGGTGDDVLALLGADGDDIFHIATSGRLPAVDPGNDVVFIEHGPSGDVIVAANIETLDIEGGDGDDLATLSGSFADAGVGTILFDGGDGDDELLGYDQLSGSVEITAYGGTGNDLLVGGVGNDRLDGGEGNDLLGGAEGNDLVLGDDGDDEIVWYGGRTGGVTFGGGSFDSGSYDGGTFSGDGNDVIDGGDGYDTLVLVTGDHGDGITLSTGGLPDDSYGGDTLLADIDGGNAVLEATNIERVEIDLGEGDDLVLIEGDLADAGVQSVVVYGNGGDDTIVGDLYGAYALLYGVYGGVGLSSLAEVELDDGGVGYEITADGGAGNDTLVGASGNDTLSGGDDDDLLVGLGGNDELSGGAGNDTFVWNDEGGTDAAQGGDGTDELVIVTNFHERATVTVSQNAGNDLIVEVDGTTAVVADEVERLVILTGDANDLVVIGNVADTDLEGEAGPGSGGDIDAFVTGSNPNHVWLNDGSGTFSAGDNVSAGPSTSDVALGDLDGDGDLDAFLTDACGGGRVFLNDGEGTLNNSGQSLGSASRAGVLGDFDGDGDLDAFAANSCGGG